MSRLTERFSNGQAGAYWCGDNCKYDYKYCDPDDGNCPALCDIFEKLAHYEDLEEQGRLMELPCAIGSTIYEIAHSRHILEVEVIRFDTKEVQPYLSRGANVPEHIHVRYNGYHKRFFTKDVGKTVFLTKAEAEAKLAELKEGEL